MFKDYKGSLIEKILEKILKGLDSFLEYLFTYFAKKFIRTEVLAIHKSRLDFNSIERLISDWEYVLKYDLCEEIKTSLRDLVEIPEAEYSDDIMLIILKLLIKDREYMKNLVSTNYYEKRIPGSPTDNFDYASRRIEEGLKHILNDQKYMFEIIIRRQGFLTEREKNDLIDLALSKQRFDLLEIINEIIIISNKTKDNR